MTTETEGLRQRVATLEAALRQAKRDHGDFMKRVRKAKTLEEAQQVVATDPRGAGCTDKRSYDDPITAVKSVAAIKAKEERRGLVVYECGFCGKYHHGNKGLG